jgi:hypothetical protein
LIAARKQNQQVTKIAAARIAQLPDVLDTGKWIIRVVSDGKIALRHGAADKRASSFPFHQQASFIVTKLNWVVGIITHVESSNSCRRSSHLAWRGHIDRIMAHPN